MSSRAFGRLRASVACCARGAAPYLLGEQVEKLGAARQECVKRPESAPKRLAHTFKCPKVSPILP